MNQKLVAKSLQYTSPVELNIASHFIELMLRNIEAEKDILQKTKIFKKRSLDIDLYLSSQIKRSSVCGIFEDTSLFINNRSLNIPNINNPSKRIITQLVEVEDDSSENELSTSNDLT